MPLSQRQLQEVCLAYSGTSECCRYLEEDKSEWGKWYCLKKTSKKKEIDSSLDELIRDHRKKGSNPYKTNLPMADNCPGYLILRHLEQGFDVD